MFRWVHDTYRLTYVTTLLYDFVSNADPCTGLINVSNIAMKTQVSDFLMRSLLVIVLLHYD